MQEPRGALAEILKFFYSEHVYPYYLYNNGDDNNNKFLKTRKTCSYSVLSSLCPQFSSLKLLVTPVAWIPCLVPDCSHHPPFTISITLDSQPMPFGLSQSGKKGDWPLLQESAWSSKIRTSEDVFGGKTKEGFLEEEEFALTLERWIIFLTPPTTHIMLQTT